MRSFLFLNSFNNGVSCHQEKVVLQQMILIFSYLALYFLLKQIF